MGREVTMETVNGLLDMVIGLPDSGEYRVVRDANRVVLATGNIRVDADTTLVLEQVVDILTGQTSWHSTGEFGPRLSEMEVIAWVATHGR